MIQYKREKISAWQHDGSLPERDIMFFSADLDDEDDLSDLVENLTPELETYPSFVLLEGITYYLNMEMLRVLFDLFSSTQLPGSALAFDFWASDFNNYPIAARFKKFFAERFGYGEADYNLLDAAFARGLRGYECVEMTDVREQEAVFAASDILSDDSELLPEHYAVLRKI